MADTWEEVAQNAANGSSGLGSGAGAQAPMDQTATQAGEQALGGGQSWQEAGQGALQGGQTLGSGGGGYTSYSSNGQTFDPTQWGAAGSAAVSGGGGGGGTSGQNANNQGMPPLNSTGSGGNSAGGGGGGGGSGGSSQQQQPSRFPGTGGGITQGVPQQQQGLSGLLQSVLGQGIAKMFQDRSTPIASGSNNINIPGISQSQGVGATSSSGSSFGNLFSNNQQQQTSSSQPVSMQQAAQNSMQTFGAQASPGSSPFGAVGQSGSDSGSNGGGFAGSPPTPYQALSQGQMTQPGQFSPSEYSTGPTMAGQSALGGDPSQNAVGAPGGSMSAPASGVPGGGGTSPGGVNNRPIQGGLSGSNQDLSNPHQAGVSGDAGPQDPSSASDQGRAAMKTFVDPTNPDVKIQVSPQDTGRKAMATFVDPTNPEVKITTGGNTYSGLNPTGAPVGLKENMDPKTKALFSSATQGLKNTGMDVVNTAAFPFRSKESNAAAVKAQAEDNNKTMMDTKDFPGVYAAGRTAGEIAPWLVAQAMSGGSSLLARLGIGAAVNGAYGLSQPGTGTEKLTHGAEGAIVGSVFNAAGPIASTVGIPAMSAAAGAYTGYKSGHDLLDTAYKTAAGAAIGWGAGAGAKYSANKSGLTGYITNLLGLGAKEAVPTGFKDLPEIQTALQSAGTVTKESDPAAKAAYLLHKAGTDAKDAWHAANPSFDKTLFDSAKEQKEAIATFAGSIPNKPADFGMPHPHAQDWIKDHGADLEWMKAHMDDPNVAPTLSAMLAQGKPAAPAGPGLVSQVAGTTAAQTIKNTAALATTGALTRPNDQVTNGPSKPLDTFQAFVNPPTSSPEAVQAHASTPMKAQVPPEVSKAAVTNAKDLKAQTTNIKLLSQSPAEFDKFVDSNEGRSELLDKAYLYGGVKGMKEVQTLLQARDNIPKYAQNSDVPTSLSGALQQKMQQTNAMKAESQFGAATGTQPGFLTPELAAKAPPGAPGVPQKPVGAQPPVAGGVGAVVDNGPPTGRGRALMQPATMNPDGSVAPQLGGRQGYMGSNPQAQLAGQRSALNARIMSLVMSYLTKSGKYQAMLRKGGMAGQGARLLMNSLSLKSMGA